MAEDVAAFCRRVRPRLVGALSLQVGDAAVAEELAQEALLRAWSRWRRVRTLDAPEAWVHRVASNLAASWGRRRAAEHRARRRYGPHPETTGGNEDHVAVREAVARLPRRQREAVVLRYYLGYPVAATAEAMGCAPGTVKALCHQAVAQLRATGVHTGEPVDPATARGGQP